MDEPRSTSTAQALTEDGQPSRSVALGGTCFALYAFDIGFQIDLDAAGTLVQDSTRQRVVRARRPAPIWFDYTPAPLSLVLEGTPIQLGGLATEASITMLIYDFGAALLTYRLPLPRQLDGLPELSMALYENQALLADATAHMRRTMELIRSAIERPRLNESVEDYAVFAMTSWGDADPGSIVQAHRRLIARVIEAESAELAEEQAERVTSGRMSYAPRDLAIVDWNAAILFDEAPEDVLAVLQHANVELLELRVLDQELDRLLDHADETMARLVRRRVWPTFEEARMLGRFASVQTDAAVMFEGVNNAIKLLGNQYLARLYRLCADRLDLGSWQASVKRKLGATESLYQKMSDASGARRLETLEWVIIVLIGVSIVLSLVGPH
jgi:hypothetical protein